MRSFRSVPVHVSVPALLVVAIASATASTARAQQQAQGFAVDRFYRSAPGAGWFVMDDLRMGGGLDGVAALTLDYASQSLRVTDGSQRLSVISDQLLADFGFAVTYDRWRFYLNLDWPLLRIGDSGTVAGYAFTAPKVNPGLNPDTLADPRIGVDVRLLGEESSTFRLGVGAQIFVPNVSLADGSTQATYDTDGTLRAMARILVAGDAGRFAYSGQLGIHVRPLDDSPTPGSPQGSEFLFGVAGGPRFVLDDRRPTTLTVGPEIFGESAFRSLFGTYATGLEALASGRLETAFGDGTRLHVKLGTGAGLDARFGAPEWRAVAGVEVIPRR